MGQGRVWGCASRIASRIVERRREAPITTTQDLVATIGNPAALKLKRPEWTRGLHPATRTFQAWPRVSGARVSGPRDLDPGFKPPGFGPRVLGPGIGDPRFWAPGFGSSGAGADR
jgi:MraW methylase family